MNGILVNLRKIRNSTLSREKIVFETMNE